MSTSARELTFPIAPAGVEASTCTVVHFEKEGLRAVYAFHPDTVLDVAHIALWLGVSHATAENLPIRWIPLGGGKHKQRFLRRALAKHVLQYLEELAT